ncbi:MAG TPA: intradiol ring-cleavage dioxygenase, partial [Herpetosiphonaceae bacterium]|nr:intradiol ring-cleavage dioxygenase [Herpetosiphonaceae bacterium]
MDNDDVPVGRVLSRREVLALFGVAGAAVLAGCSSEAGSTAQPTAAQPTAAQPTAQAAASATPGVNAEAATSVSEATVADAAGSAPLPSCVVSPEMTEGPYFVDEQLERSDIRSDP